MRCSTGNGTIFFPREEVMKSATGQKWQGQWDQLKGRVKQMWGQLTDDDLKKVEGNYDRLVGLIEQRTGEAREQIEKRLNA
jgi:uncharacterized protein YjbJ (UPF0337 family)